MAHLPPCLLWWLPFLLSHSYPLALFPTSEVIFANFWTLYKWNVHTSFVRTHMCVWFVHGLSITALCSFFSIYIFYQMYVPQFMYMFSYWWIFGLFPHFGSYKWCCCEHSSTYLLSIHMHTILLYMPRVEVLASTSVLEVLNLSSFNV